METTSTVVSVVLWMLIFGIFCISVAYGVISVIEFVVQKLFKKKVIPEMLPEFVPYGKTARLFRDIIITEKIDGVNGLIKIENGEIYAGSRKQWLTARDHNWGFHTWVMQNKESLIRDLGEGEHHGEWYGQKIGRRYDLDHKRFALFNTVKWGKVTFETENLGISAVLYQGIFDQNKINLAIDKLRSGGSVVAPGFMKPEGICVFHTHSNTVFKVTLENDRLHKTEV